MANKNECLNLKKRWATKNVMQQIYKQRLWGGDGTDFYSGIGSHDPRIVIPYVALMRGFLTSFKVPLSVCDLGCGDFNVGHQLVGFSKQYTGVDIVEDLITRNRVKFNKVNLEFQCLDICEDKLPSADCAFLRQVLQHLSNKEIQELVPKLKTYKYLIVTEHLPSSIFVANQDIVTGQGIRLKRNSGVNLMTEPFNLKAKLVKVILEVHYDHKSIIRTTLYQNY